MLLQVENLSPGAAARPRLRRRLAVSIFFPAGITAAVHLAAFNLGPKSIPVDRRRQLDCEIRLLAIAQRSMSPRSAAGSGFAGKEDRDRCCGQ